MAHLGEVGVLALLLNVDGIGMLARWLCLPQRWLAGTDVKCGQRWCVGTGAGDCDVGAAVIDLLLHFARGVTVSHETVPESTPLISPPLLPPCSFFAGCLLLFSCS